MLTHAYQILRDRAARSASSIALGGQSGLAWRTITSRQLLEFSETLARQLGERGVREGDRVVAIDATLLRDGRWEGELVHALRSGAQIVVASRQALQRDDSGRAVAILEINTDISDRKRIETEQQRLFRRSKPPRPNSARCWNRRRMRCDRWAGWAHGTDQSSDRGAVRVPTRRAAWAAGGGAGPGTM
jgi:hypothetical protein